MTASASPTQRAFADWVEGARAYPLWSHLAFRDVYAKYRNSVLGPLWVSGGLIVMSLSLALVFGSMMGGSIVELLPYVMGGIMLFNIISLPISEGCEALMMGSPIIKTQATPFSIHFYRLISRNFFLLAHNIVVYYAMLVIIGAFVVPNFWLIPMLLLVSVFAVAGSTITAMAATRFRDLRFLFPYLSMLLFFTTPIFWNVDAVQDSRKFLYEFNPLYYLLESVRAPLMGKAPSPDIIVTSVLITLGTCLIAFVFFAMHRRRIPFWV